MSAGANIGKCIEQVVLIPLGRVAISMAIKSITMDTVNWIKDSGHGQASYVKNLPQDLQGVGDVAAGALISQLAQGALGNSPFASTITNALSTIYNTESSLAGFYAANQCTLDQYTNDANAFLSGYGSQAGNINVWLALTTQDQNNPYTLYNSVLSRMGSNVGTAQSVRMGNITMSGGFLSWCAPQSSIDTTAGQGGSCTSDSACGKGLYCIDGVCTSGTAKQGSSCSSDSMCGNGLYCIGGVCTSGSAQSGSACSSDSMCGNGLYCIDSVCTSGTAQEGSACTSDAMCGSGFSCIVGVCQNVAGNTPPSCTNKDGTPGVVTTPGATIKAFLDKNLGTGIGQLVSAQDIDDSIAAILSAFSTKIMNDTIYKPGGLFGSSQSSGSTLVSPLPVSQDALGNITQSALSDAETVSSSMGTYIASAQTVFGAANAAASSTQAYIDAEPAFVAGVNAAAVAATSATTSAAYCPALIQARASVLADASTTLAQAQALLLPGGTITGAIDMASSSIADAEQMQALVVKVKAEATATSTQVDPQTFSSDVATLTTAGPTTMDIMAMEGNATATGGATTTPNPDGTPSLSVGGGTILDEMNLLKKNADSLISAWNAEINKAQDSCVSTSIY